MRNEENYYTEIYKETVILYFVLKIIFLKFT